MTAKKLIVHIDDIGSSSSGNRAAFELLEGNFATSGSIMIPGPAFHEVQTYIKGKEYDLGVHLTLTSEWSSPNNRRMPTLPVEDVPSLVDSEGFFWGTVDEVLTNANPIEIEKELSNQIILAQKIGISPSHIDSHMGVLLHKKFFHIYKNLAKKFNIQPFICLPRPHDSSGHWFYASGADIMDLEENGFTIIDQYDPFSLYEGLVDYHTHLTNRITLTQPGITYMLFHVLDNNLTLDEKTPDYKKRQKEYEYLKGGTGDIIIEAYNIQKTNMVTL